MIVCAIILSLVEVVLSTMNAVEEDSWKLTNFEDFVYSASSLMEAVGLVHGVGSFFIEDENNRLSSLGLPLVVISNGVWDDVKEIRMSGFRGTIIQATCAFALLVVWFCLIVDWGYIIVVASFVLGICYCFRPFYYQHAFGSSIDTSAVAMPPALTRDEVETPNDEENPKCLAYVIRDRGFGVYLLTSGLLLGRT